MLRYEPGQRLVEAVQQRIDAFIDKWAGTYPAAMRAMEADRASHTVYLQFPAGHHKRIRHSNFIERTFGETRRRVKVIGRFPGETSCTGLLWAVLEQRRTRLARLHHDTQGPAHPARPPPHPARSANPALQETR